MYTIKNLSCNLWILCTQRKSWIQIHDDDDQHVKSKVTWEGLRVERFWLGPNGQCDKRQGSMDNHSTGNVFPLVTTVSYGKSWESHSGPKGLKDPFRFIFGLKRCMIVHFGVQEVEWSSFWVLVGQKKFILGSQRFMEAHFAF